MTDENNKNTTYDFVGLGDIVIDTFIEIENAWIEDDNPEAKKELCMSFGEKLPYRDTVVVKGTGNAANAVNAANKLGLKTAMISNIGDDDDADEIVKDLSDRGIDSTNIKKHANTKTNHNYILRYKAERTILVHHNHYEYSLPENMPKTKWLYLSSLAENSIPHHHEIAKYLSENPETKLAFQPGTFQIKLGKDELSDLYKVTEIFFCNKEEAQKILETKEEDMKILLSGVRQLGPKIVVITDGPEGAYTFDGNEYLRGTIYPDPKPPVDRTGAGDSFSATFTVAIAKGKSIQDALLWGPINSMNVVQYVGAQAGHLTESELLELLENKPESFQVEEI